MARGRNVVLIVIALAGAFTAVVVGLLRSQSPPSFVIERADGSTRGRKGAWLEGALALRFSDGALFELSGGSLKVTETHVGGATLALATGTLTATAPSGTYRVDAGAVRVDVSGTAELTVEPGGVKVAVASGQAVAASSCVSAPVRIGAGDARTLTCN